MQVTFALAWYFPNRYVNWSQAGFGIKDEKTQYWLGNQYGIMFTSLDDVLNNARDNFEVKRHVPMVDTLGWLGLDMLTNTVTYG